MANIVMHLKDREMANARLIAASPDLLSAAKLVASKWSGNPDPEFAVLDAAISKAEGR